MIGVYHDCFYMMRSSFRLYSAVENWWKLLGNYPYLKNMEIYSSVWKIKYDFCYSQFFKNIYTYTLSNMIYLVKYSGNILSNYHGTFIYTFMHGCDHNLIYIYIKPFFFLVNIVVIFADVYSFLSRLLLKIFFFFQVEFSSWVDIIKVSVMLSTTSKSSSTFHSFFQ